LFYVGISLLLRNVWVLLHATLLADGNAVHPEPCLGKLRYADLLEWLSDYIKTLLAVSIGFRIDCDTGKRLTAEDVT